MSNVLYLIGLFTFALLIGIVSDAVSEKVEDVRHGNHQVLERVRSPNQSHAHCLLLRWSPPSRRRQCERRASTIHPNGHARESGPATYGMH